MNEIEARLHALNETEGKCILCNAVVAPFTGLVALTSVEAHGLSALVSFRVCDDCCKQHNNSLNEIIPVVDEIIRNQIDTPTLQ